MKKHGGRRSAGLSNRDEKIRKSFDSLIEYIYGKADEHESGLVPEDGRDRGKILSRCYDAREIVDKVLCYSARKSLDAIGKEGAEWDAFTSAVVSILEDMD